MLLFLVLFVVFNILVFITLTGVFTLLGGKSPEWPQWVVMIGMGIWFVGWFIDWIRPKF